MMFVVFLVAVGFLQAAMAAQWQTGTLSKYTSLLGVHAVKSNEAYGSVMDNAVGYGVVRTEDYAATGTFYGPAGAMNMDVAFSADGSVGALVGLGGIFIGPAASSDYKRVEDIHAITQNVESWSDKSFGVTGQFAFSAKDAVNGVCISKDGGSSWEHYDIGLDASKYYARYGAFPSDTTWFVSSGMWPSTARAAPTRRDASQLTAYLQVSANQTMSARVSEPRGRAKDGETGWYGAISRTTNGGQTWSQVYSTDLFYFNQIHCSDTGTCMAVGENDEGAYVVGTKDGGNSWTTVLTAPQGVSLVAVRMLAPNEAWVSGGAQSRAAGLQGYYYHTTDGGNTWTLDNANGYSFDLSFRDGVGYSAFLTQSYSSMAVYK